MELSQDAELELETFYSIFQEDELSIERTDDLVFVSVLVKVPLSHPSKNVIDESNEANFKLHFSLTPLYPNEPPEIKLVESNLSEDLEDHILRDLSESAERSKCTEMLFNLITTAREATERIVDCECDTQETNVKEVPFKGTPIIKETFEKWQEGMNLRIKDTLDSYIKSGYTEAEAYLKFPSYMRAVAYINGVFNKNIDGTMQGDLTGRQIFELNGEADEDEIEND